MSASDAALTWDAPVDGAFTRALRFGEWIPEPVTPLFESWLLTRMEERMHATLDRWTGQRAPRPYHVVVNGWYFYSINFLSGRAMARSLPSVLVQLVREPRRVAGVIPPTVRHSFPLFEREWRHDLQPRYRLAAARAAATVDDVPAAELPALVDDLADLAGEYFASIAALAGAGYKLEMNLARFYRRHLAPSLGGSHLPLVTGFDPPGDRLAHDVWSLDWWHPTSSGPAGDVARSDHECLVAARESAERDARRILASEPGRQRAFERLLGDAQHLVPLREEQVRELTLPWPVMRRAALRMGATLASAGMLAEPEDVFFLTRGEVLAAIAGSAGAPIDVHGRKVDWRIASRLTPPLLIGRLNPMLRRLFDQYPVMVGAAPSGRALVSGTPTSPGRATGPVRVIRGPHEFADLRPGEVLVAPLTAPAWTPLFGLAAAVVTDVGSAAAHASVIAREYGIPAVVGCGDATVRLRTGMRVTVDGGAGNVEPA